MRSVSAIRLNLTVMCYSHLFLVWRYFVVTTVYKSVANFYAH